MRTNLLSRLERLEAQAQAAREEMIQIGPLKRLPDDFLGDRHVVVVKRYPSSTPNWETCDFEEQPGPEPPGVHEGANRIYLDEDDWRLL